MHNLPIAETKLLPLPQTVLSDTKARPFVAVLWNNLGLQQEAVHGTQVSVKAFKKAAALDDSNPVILMNLAHAYWEQRDHALNQDLLDKLIRLAPDEPFPHLAMADLLQEQNQPSEASKHLAHAADRARQDPALQSYLASVTAKLHRIESVESRMTARSSTHFIVKLDGAEDHGAWTAVLEILEDAYREIGQKLGHFPSRPIVVVLHTRDSFLRRDWSSLTNFDSYIIAGNTDNPNVTSINAGNMGSSNAPSDTTVATGAHNNLPPMYGVYVIKRTAREYYKV